MHLESSHIFLFEDLLQMSPQTALCLAWTIENRLLEDGGSSNDVNDSNESSRQAAAGLAVMASTLLIIGNVYQTDTASGL